MGLNCLLRTCDFSILLGFLVNFTIDVNFTAAWVYLYGYYKGER